MIRFDLRYRARRKLSELYVDNLFSEVTRSDHRPANRAEPHFRYLDMSARPGYEAIRNLLEEWFSKYPNQSSNRAESRRDLRSAFRSSDDRQHLGALTELTAHELALRLNCEVRVHPRLNARARRPDFLIRDAGGTECILECVTTLIESDSEAAERKVMSILYDALDRTHTTDFWLDVHLIRASTRAPNASVLRSHLERVLRSLDRESLLKTQSREGTSALPVWRLQSNGLEIEVRPIPRKTDKARRVGLRAVGSTMGPIRIVVADSQMRDAIRKKATAYGDLGMPYVVAINAISFPFPARSFDEIDLMNALFGPEVLRVYVPSDSGMQEREEWTRDPKGVWTSPRGPVNTRVSAVLSFAGLDTSRLSSTPVLLVHNPWARAPLKGPLTTLPQVLRDGDQLRKVDGVPLSKIFELSPDFPRDIPDEED